MPKTSPMDVLQWTQVVMQLITIGATSYATVRQATQDAGWPEDDARLMALDAEYAARIARAQAVANPPSQ